MSALPRAIAVRQKEADRKKERTRHARISSEDANHDRAKLAPYNDSTYSYVANPVQDV